MKKREKKVYTTPEGLKHGASASFSTASFLWIINLIWQYAIAFLQPSGWFSLIFTLIGFGLLLAAAIIAYNAFDTEIQADAIASETLDKTLPKLKKLVMACIIIRFLLTPLALFNTGLIRPQSVALYTDIDALINILGNLFTTVNIFCIFTYKIYVTDGHDGKVRIYALLAIIFSVARILLTELRYGLQLVDKISIPLSYAATLTAVISYFAFFLMFEARKVLYKPTAKPEEEQQQ